MPNTLIAKLAKIMGKVQAMPKEGKNEFQRFDFVTIYQQLEFVRPLMAQTGVIMYPEVTEKSLGETQTRAGGTSTVCILTIRWTVIDGESEIHLTSIGEAHDSGDKAANKAQTAAHKQALTKLFMLTPDEDNDANSPPERGRAAQDRPPAPRPQAQASSSQYGICPEHNTEWFMRGKMRSPAHPIADTNQWCNKPDNPPDGPRTPVQPRNEGEQGDGPIEDDAPPFSAAEEAAMGQDQGVRPLWPEGRAQEFMDWALAELEQTDQAALFSGPRDVLVILKPDGWIGEQWNGTEMMSTMSEDEAWGRITHYVERQEGGAA